MTQLRLHHSDDLLQSFLEAWAERLAPPRPVTTSAPCGPHLRRLVAERDRLTAEVLRLREAASGGGACEPERVSGVLARLKHLLSTLDGLENRLLLDECLLDVGGEGE